MAKGRGSEEGSAVRPLEGSEDGMVSARDASITDDTGSGIPAREFLEILDGEEEGHESAAVALGDDERLVLQLL